MDKFDFSGELAELERAGLKRDNFICPQGLVNLSSNDYLGLSKHEDVKKAAIRALEEFGTGGTSSRLLAGTKPPHQDLEKELAQFCSKEAALVFSSGFQANSGILAAVAKAKDVIFFDRLAHASLIDGIRLSSARFFSFEHNDLDDLKKKLVAKREAYDRAFIVTEGIFSMDGDYSPIADLVELAGNFQAHVYLDEAHSFGVVGPEGRGWAAQQKVLDEIDIFVATLSKSLGSQGGFVASAKSFCDLLVSRSRPFLYTTALAPASAAAALAALRLVPELGDRRDLISRTAGFIREQLAALHFSVLNSHSQIIPVWTGDVETTKKLSFHLLKSGFFVPSIRPPTVAPGEGRVRISVTHDVAAGDAEKLVSAFKSFPERPERRNEKIVQVL